MIDNSIFNKYYKITHPIDLNLNTIDIQLLNISNKHYITTLMDAIYNYNKISYIDELIDEVHQTAVDSTETAIEQYYDKHTNTYFLKGFHKNEWVDIQSGDGMVRECYLDVPIYDESQLEYIWVSSLHTSGSIYIISIYNSTDHSTHIYSNRLVNVKYIDITKYYGLTPPGLAKSFKYIDSNGNIFRIINSNSSWAYALFFKHNTNGEKLYQSALLHHNDTTYISPGSFANIIYEDSDYLYGLKFEGYDFNLGNDDDTDSTQSVEIFKQDKNDITEDMSFSDELDFDQFRVDEFVTDQIQGDIRPPAVLRHKVTVDSESFNILQYGYKQIDDDDNNYLKIYFKKFVINDAGDNFDSVDTINIDFGDYENKFRWEDLRAIGAADNIFKVQESANGVFLIQIKTFFPDRANGYYELFYWKFTDSSNIKLLDYTHIDFVNVANDALGILSEVIDSKAYYLFSDSNINKRIIFDDVNETIKIDDIHFYHDDNEISGSIEQIFQNQDRVYVTYGDQSSGFIPQDFKLNYFKRINFEWAQDSYSKTENDDIIIPVTLHIKDELTNEYVEGTVDLLLSEEGYFEDTNSREYDDLHVPSNGTTLNVVVTKAGNLKIKGTVHD